jgi:hypothetical protein
MALLGVTISAAGLVQIMSRLERILDVAHGTQQIPFRKRGTNFSVGFCSDNFC